MKTPEFWFGIRIGIVALSTANGFFVPFDGPDIPIFLILLVLIFSTLASLHMLRYTSKKYESRYNWSKPSWFTNPFSGPSHFTHLGSYFFIGIGLGELTRAAISNQPIAIHLFSLMFGLGLYLGLTIFYVFMYEKK